MYKSRSRKKFLLKTTGISTTKKFEFMMVARSTNGKTNRLPQLLSLVFPDSRSSSASG